MGPAHAQSRAPSVGAHGDADSDAHAPDADNAGGIIMLMRMEMIWRIHISAYAAHMHAMAATRWLASHTRRLGGSHHLGLVDGRAHRTCTGCTGMDGRGSVARTGRGREWAWGAAGASTAPEAGGGGAPLRAGRRPTRSSKRRAAVGVAIQIAPDLHEGPSLRGGDVLVVPRGQKVHASSPHKAAKAAIEGSFSVPRRVSAQNLVTPKIARVSLVSGLLGGEPNV